MVPSNSKSHWNFIYKLLHTKDVISCVLPFNFSCTIADFFVDKVRRLHDLITTELGNSLRFPLAYDRPFTGTIFSQFTPVSPDKVYKLLCSTKIKQSPIDNFLSLLIKNCKSVFSHIICRLANMSLQQSHFPTIYKRAHITPSIKKPSLNKNEPSNYRPIS